jgi:hypothetical protein
MPFFTHVLSFEHSILWPFRLSINYLFYFLVHSGRSAHQRYNSLLRRHASLSIREGSGGVVIGGGGGTRQQQRRWRPGVDTKSVQSWRSLSTERGRKISLGMMGKAANPEELMKRF